MKRISHFWWLACFLWMWAGGGGIVATEGEGAYPGGALVLSFDDGSSNWLEVVAPELREVGGKASAFVNNQYLPGRISFGELRRLRDEFGWEIGSHGFHHVNAPSRVRRIGLEAWVAEELDASLQGLRSEGFTPGIFVFPYNEFDEALAAAALGRVRSLRRAVPMAFARSRPSSFHPATCIDMAAHVPLEQLVTWIDAAARANAALFLYAHRILPDEAFVEGRVIAVREGELEVDTPLPPVPPAESWMLVPDLGARVVRSGGLFVRSTDGPFLRVDAQDLPELTRPGATFRIGPAQATPLSDFRALLRHAHTRGLRFLTVGEALTPSKNE